MKIQICILLLLTIFSFSFAQRRRTFFSRNAAKGQSASRPHSSPEECGKEVEDKHSESYKRLVRLGYRETRIPPNDHKHDGFCKSAKDDIKVFEDHVRCIEGEHRKFFNLLAKGFRMSYNDRCNNKTWHDLYVKYMKCMREDSVFERFHICGDKFYTAMAHSLRNVPEKDQGKSVCCIAPMFAECVTDEIDELCGQDAVDFSLKMIYENFEDALDYMCDGKSDEICEKYPKIKKKYDEIFEAEKAPIQGNYYKLFFKLVKNEFSVDNL